MAQGTDIKLYVALGVLAALGGALYFQTKSKKEDAAAHTFEGVNANLPKLEIKEEQTSKVTKLVIEQPAKTGDSPKPASKHVLVKGADGWTLAEPVPALANQSNVESLLKNLPKLSIKERIAQGADTYAQYDLTDDKAVHVTAFEGDKPAVELWLGKSGGRGQMVRVKDQPGVYVLDGYSSFLYARDTKGWRDLSILKMETEKATRVDIENEKGSFTFKKEGSEWKAEYKKAKGAAGKVKDFEPSKVEDLLRAYKSLNASDFGDGKSLADTGLETPAAKLVITLESGEKREIVFGGTAEGSSRWAKLADKEAIYAISSWASDWAFAEESKFQKKKDGEKEEGGEAPDLEGMGMPPGMMGMPPGHP